MSGHGGLLSMLMAIALVAIANSGPAGAVEQAAPSGSARDAEGFVLADRPVAFEFPRDHGPHPQFRQEWWYVTGNLAGPTAQRFGFELTFFRVAIAAPERGGSGVEVARHEGWRADQIYLAHFAITDVARNTFRFAQKTERGALGLAGAQALPLHVWLDDWQIAANSATIWSLHGQQQHYELDLQLQPLSAPILNGDQGLSVKGNQPGAASYYYSIPRLSVRGRLTRDGVPIEVSGAAWLDREWGSGLLASNEAGWDWYALQLDDGGSLMFYTLRNRDGSRESHSAGTWIDRNGVQRSLASDEVDIEVMDHWLSPRGARYPSRWNIRIPVLSLNLMVTPALQNQELETTPPYWEGAVNVTSPLEGGKSLGRGYVELVGY
jgi:predicted secreted hydrolase